MKQSMSARRAVQHLLTVLLATARAGPSLGRTGAATQLTRRALVGSAVLLPAAASRAQVRYAPARYALVPQGSVRDKEKRLSEVNSELKKKPDDPYLAGEGAQLEYDLERLRENAAAVGRLKSAAASGGAYAAALSVRVPDLAAARKFWVDGLKMSELSSSRVGDADAILVGYGSDSLGSDDGGKFALELVQATAAAPAPAPLGAAESAGANGALLFVQLRVPNVRISGLIDSGGVIESAYGFVEVTAPGGLAVRVLTAPRRDPFEFVAVRAADVEASAAYYERAFGMRRVPAPALRTERGPGLLGTGLFGKMFEVQDDVLAPQTLYGSVLMVPGYANGQADSTGVLLVPPSAKTAPPGLRTAGGDGDPIVTLRASDVAAASKAAGADGGGGLARDPSGARVRVAELP